MKDIDLARAFRSWGWEVSKAIEQDYHIELLIRGDGSVIVSPSAEAIVLDWQDGGVIW